MRVKRPAKIANPIKFSNIKHILPRVSPYWDYLVIRDMTAAKTGLP
jgi:hypothetical protein